MHYLARREESGGERIAELLHEANENWVRMQDDEGWLPLHWACQEGNHSVIRTLLSLYPEGVRVTTAEGWLPIHYLRIWNEPDEEVTSEDINNTKLLVSAWPESANIPRQDSNNDIIYNNRQDEGWSSCSASLRLCPACEPSATTLCELNYPPRRAMLVMLFSVIDVRDQQPLVVGLRQLRRDRRGGMSMLRHIASFL
jgi:ankyrin repeat protein